MLILLDVYKYFVVQALFFSDVYVIFKKNVLFIFIKFHDDFTSLLFHIFC